MILVTQFVEYMIRRHLYDHKNKHFIVNHIKFATKQCTNENIDTLDVNVNVKKLFTIHDNQRKST